ncbi:MAG: PD-(D/E)XK nuclease family protein, partial [Actinomycetaceae bacterium]|nr:PD-(D/E)XK nuclease family protein [Actinomycetaceae bacterium]
HVEQSEKVKIAEILDEQHENHAKYKALFSQSDWEILEECNKCGVPPEAEVEVNEQKNYPLDLRRNLGAFLPYDEQSAGRELENLKAQSVLLLKELEEAGKKREVLRSYLTASDIVRMAGKPDDFFAEQQRPIPREPSRKARIGTQVHQRIADSYLVAPIIDLDMPEENPLPHEEKIAALVEAFQQSSWTRFPKLHIETPISFALAGCVIRCTIDAVLDTTSDSELRDITIVDWKTGAVPRGKDLEAKQLQLALYRLAYAKAYRCALDNIGAAFVYLSEDGTIREIYADDIPEEEIVTLIFQGAGGNVLVE